jgi:hypothetical protein
LEFEPYQGLGLGFVLFRQGPARLGERMLAVKTPPTPPAAEHVVLVIDDDPAVRSSLKFSLEVEGFTGCCSSSILRQRSSGIVLASSGLLVQAGAWVTKSLGETQRAALLKKQSVSSRGRLLGMQTVQ